MFEHSNWNPYRFMRYRIKFSSEKLGLSNDIENNAWKILLESGCTTAESMVDLGCSLYAAALYAQDRIGLNDIAGAVGISEKRLKSRYEEMVKSLEKAVAKLIE